MKHLIIVVIALITIGQIQSQTFIGNQKDINTILESTKKFSQYVINDNYKMIGESYTADAKIFPNQTKIIEGTNAIVSYWKHPDDISITHHKITQSEIKIMGAEAYDYGYYEGQTKKANGDLIDWKGKYVIIWRKEGEDWKMYLDIWNGVR